MKSPVEAEPQSPEPQSNDDQENERSAVQDSKAVQNAKPAKPPRRGRFKTNVSSNLILFGLNILIGLWFTPFLIRHLGVAAYGLVPLITTMTKYISIITLGLNAAVARYITIALEQDDEQRANRIFNTSLVGSLLMVLVLLGPCMWLAFHVEQFLQVPAGFEEPARWLMACTIGAFLLSQIETPFAVATYVRNRFDLRNMVTICESLTRVGLVALLFAVTAPRLWHVGAGVITAAMVSILGTLPLWRSLTPSLRIRPFQFDLSTLRSLTGIGLWSIIGYVGALLLVGIDLLVVNRLLGPLEGGRYAAALQWSVLLRSLTTTIASVFGPTIVAMYARNDISGMVRYARQAIKFLGLVIALPAGLVCGLSRPLLDLWLGPEFVPLALLMSLLTGHLGFNLGYSPMAAINQATNHVRMPAIATLVAGAANVGLAIFLAGPMKWGVYGVAAAGAIVLTLRNSVFSPLYGAYVIGQPYNTFMRDRWPSIGATAMVAGLCWLASSTWELRTWGHLFAVGLVVSILYGVIVYFVLLNAQEREAVVKMLPGANRS